MVDAVYGLNIMPFIRKNNFVDCYESNSIYLDGEIIDFFKIIILKNRIVYENLLQYINIYNYNKNFYLSNVDKNLW